MTTLAPARAGSSTAPLALLVLCRTFPKLSETFVLGETLALQRAGCDVHVAALKAPDAAPLYAELEQLQRPPRYLPAGLQAATGVLVSAQDAGHVCAANTRPAATLPAAALPAAAQTLIDALPDSKARQAAHALIAAAPANVLLPALWLAEIVQQERIDHIHAHYIAETAWIAAVAARLTGVPFSISAHAKDIYLGAPAALRSLLREAAFTATCTGYNARHLQALADEPARVQCIHHGVNVELFAPSVAAATRAMRHGQTPLLLAVGRFREKKGFDVLIDACAQLHAAGVALRCEIVGYGEAEPLLRERIRAHGLEGVATLVAPEPHQQLVQRLAGATLFTLPCRIASDGDRDGIPNVVLEAMAMALPVVSTPVSGIPEVLSHEENGLLVPADDVPALARAIARLLADAPLRQRLGAAARLRVAAQFAWTTAAERLHAAITRACLQHATHGTHAITFHEGATP